MNGPLNGKTGEFIRWVIGLGLAALVSYYTAIGSIRERVGNIDTREQGHFDEVQRTLQRMDANQEQRFNELKNYLQFIVQTGADAKTGEPYRIQGQR